LIDGYTLNEKRLKTAQYKYQELQTSLKLLSNVIQFETVSDYKKIEFSIEKIMPL